MATSAVSDAIYHVMARGNGQQAIVRDDDDRGRLQDYLGLAAARCSWRVYAFVLMTNHLHVVLKTPEPNLARGMQVDTKDRHRNLDGRRLDDRPLRDQCSGEHPRAAAKLRALLDALDPEPWGAPP